MSQLYRSPLRVYLCLACLALWGIISGWHLPISLFPDSSKPVIRVNFQYGGLTADEFMRNYGRSFEERLKAASFGSHETEKVTANYDSKNVKYSVEYKWGTPPRQALREVESVANTLAAQLPEDIRNSMGVWIRNENSGFLAVSFFSDRRSLDDLYKYLEPLILPRLTKVTEASDIGIWNPNRKEIRVELNPEKAALLQLLPAHVAEAVRGALQANGGGSVTVGLNNLNVTMNRQVDSLAQLSHVPVLTPAGQVVHLGDVAQIDFGVPSDGQRVMKTSGVPSLILFAEPRPGGNIKKMAEDVLAILDEVSPSFASDVKFKVIVDPSFFIRSAVNNVLHEVFLAALLAVVVLFVFIGNFRNVITAAIEIPMSIVLAFILMRWFGINLNLISLGGLALSAGMNVDASVVVMENIFRHFEEWKGPLGPADRLRIVLKAVDEVRFPVLASTIASLVVFLPLAMTSGLTNAILGDLALAVVFSHGLSAFVALVLVPTVRLQMMSGRKAATTSHSPIEKWLRKLENFYVSALRGFMERPKLKAAVYGGLAAALALLFVFVLPRLPKEIIGTPDTDWITLDMSTSGNTIVRQLDDQAGEIEAKFLRKFGSRVQYTFTQIHNANYAQIMARLKDKKDMMPLWKELEAEFPNSPFTRFSVWPWNPSELPIPDPPHLRILVRGTDVADRTLAAKEVMDLLQEKKFYQNVWSNPQVERRDEVVMRPNPDQWSALKIHGARFLPADLADLSRVATTGRKVGEMLLDGNTTNVTLRFPENRVASVEDLAALPVGLNGKLLPLGTLAQIKVEESAPMVFREDGKDLAAIQAKLKKEDESKINSTLALAQGAVEEWKKGPGKNHSASVLFDDAAKDLNEALEQLGYAVALSVLLIFITMVFQFGDVVNALLVLVAVPLGFVGALITLFVFKSTLSLNSVLGVILLNGIAVANSIILVDFLKRLVEEGRSPRAAALEAAQKRVRPILMTSLTTGLGMLPIALGFGEGGRILQPLGIAVVGGLGFSVMLTLFVVPSLQVSYLEWRDRRGGLRSAKPADHEMASRSLASGERVAAIDVPIRPTDLMN